MIKAFFLALNDMTSPEFRAVLWKSIAFSMGLFAAFWFGIEFLLSTITMVPWPWLTTTLQVATGLGLFAAFFFLMAPVTALFAGLFQDGISEVVEQRHYPSQHRGKPLAFFGALLFGVKFALLSLGINLIVFPLVFFAGFGAVLLLIANAYLISREYFEMAAQRFMSTREASALRQHHGLRVFVAGLIPGFLALVPFINFAVPVFATSYFLHFFKSVQGSLA